MADVKLWQKGGRMKHIMPVSKAQEVDAIFDAMVPLIVQLFMYIGMLARIKNEPATE